MNEQLKERIKGYRVGNSRLVCVGAQRTQYRTKLACSDEFARTGLYDEIMRATQFLPEQCDVGFRVKCILRDETEA